MSTLFKCSSSSDISNLTAQEEMTSMNDLGEKQAEDFPIEGEVGGKEA